MKDSTKKVVLRSDANKIESLPNQVLYNILSFMDMKEVVATSVISRRWRYLWESVSVLNFDHRIMKKKYRNDDNDVKNKRFMSFVDRVLLLRDSSKIDKFNIICAFDDSDRLITWLTLAARRQFQQVHFELDASQSMQFQDIHLEWEPCVPTELPDLIFTSAITVFKIVLSENFLVKIPSSVSLSPQLKTLILANVILPEGNSKGELILSCPVLENLTLKYCDLDHLSALIISTPQLKTLVFAYPRCNDCDPCSVKLWTPNLISLEWCDWDSIFSSTDLSKLVFGMFYGAYVGAINFFKVLGAMSCATIIDATFLGTEDMPNELINQFSNLRRLILFQNEDKLCFQFVLKLLKNAPCLETLILEVYEDSDFEEKIPFMAEDFEEEETPFMLSHLKSVHITGGFEKLDKVVEFLKVLLQKAIVLEELIFKMFDPYWIPSSIRTKRTFGRQIRSLARASPSITIIVK